MEIALCTLSEGHYHHGVAALVNSLAASGYEGIVWVGMRGELPAWMTERRNFNPAKNSLQVTTSLSLRVVKIDPPMSLNYFKAQFMLDVLERHQRDAVAIAYIDPDVVVKCPWNRIRQWFESPHLILVEEVHSSTLGSHSRRTAWATAFGEAQLLNFDRTQYFNSGFVGARRQHSSVLSTWADICGYVAKLGGWQRQQRKIPHDACAFTHTDEDALNFALMMSSTDVNAVNPAAMDLLPGGQHLSHAVGPIKPWQHKLVLQTILGFPQKLATLHFYQYANGPVRSLPRITLILIRLSLAWRRFFQYHV